MLMASMSPNFKYHFITKNTIVITTLSLFKTRQEQNMIYNYYQVSIEGTLRLSQTRLNSKMSSTVAPLAIV